MEEDKDISSNKKNNNSYEKVNEIVINRVISDKDVKRFNEMAPITITILNTKKQNANIIKKLNKDISIRVIGPFNDQRFSSIEYYKQTTYTPEQISAIISILDELEKGINPNWSDLEKATYAYIELIKSIKINEQIENRKPFEQVIERSANSTGYAVIYKEILDRLGIASRYFQNSKGHAWNEVLIDNEYYPCDLSSDAALNSTNFEKEITLTHFLSNKEFYHMPEHQEGEKYSQYDSKKKTLEHEKVQKAIDTISIPYNINEIRVPEIKIKSRELQNALKLNKIESIQDIKEIHKVIINCSDDKLDALVEDISKVTEYYPNVFEDVKLSNSSGQHVDMQRVVDAIYEGKKNSNGEVYSKTNITIESNIAQDFDLDFSKAAKIELNEAVPTEEDTNSQKITFINTGNGSLKLPNLSGKLSDAIDSFCFENCDLEGFDIRSSGNARNGIRLELVGGRTSGIADIIGLSDVIGIKCNGINTTEFDQVLNLCAHDSSGLPNLFEFEAERQNLQGRQFFTEINNPNIVTLTVNNCELDNIVGLDRIKDQLVTLDLYSNNIPINDLKTVNTYMRSNPLLRACFCYDEQITSKVNGLSGNNISDETFNYLDSYFKRSGYIKYRNMSYSNLADADSRKKGMLKDFTRHSLHKVPYFIEDAKIFREELPFTNNPMMIKDLSTFQTYLNDSSDYFNQNHLRDGILWLTKEQLTELINSGKTIPQNIHIKINTAAELSKTELENFKNDCDRLGLNLTGINIFDDRCLEPNIHNFDGYDNQLATYNINEFGQIRETLETISQGIRPYMTEAEKFAVIYKRLSDLIIYNYDACNEPESKDKAIYIGKNYDSCRNLLGGLIPKEGFNNPTIKNRAVCAGYADILKNALAMVGIESVLDPGNARRYTGGNEGGSHKWNKVRIDGKWYYCDLCWDAGKNLVNNPKWCLNGSNEFINTNIRNTDADGNQYETTHLTRATNRNEQMENDNFDIAVLKDLFYQVEHEELPRKEIEIPNDPSFTFNVTIEAENIKNEYLNKKDDMIAKYYGNRDYKIKYKEISARYRENEVEVTKGGITYRTVQDYPEREADEQFLLLDNYKDSLERMSKYEAGDTSVYRGTPLEMNEQFEKDKEYVETRNYTFNQNKNTYNDLATLGKFGETLPYIPKQQGIIKNGLRIVSNVGIAMKNIAAPVYRFVGKNVAQPIHNLITKGRDASPYKNNPYHRFVARRDYFKDISSQNDAASGKSHPLKNYILSNVNAIFNYKKGNTAVLNAGSYDIQKNLKEQRIQERCTAFYESKKIELENQILQLQNDINSNQTANNIDLARRELARKQNLVNLLEQKILGMQTTDKTTNIQTDAVNQEQHEIASKEVTTYKVVAIKGVAKLGFKKFVGPKIKDWMLEHTKQRVPRQETYQETIMIEKEVKAPSKTIPIMEKRPDYDIEVEDLIARSKGKNVKMYRSVSGGNRGEIPYEITGNEACTAFHYQDGSTWGTGFSREVPLMTDKNWPSTFLDMNGQLRANITFREISDAITSGELSPEVLNNMTLQLGNKGWVYANELFKGVTRKAEVGTKIIEGATHIEQIPQVINKTRTVYDIVNNQRVINALGGIGVINTIAGAMDTALNVGEILRPTNSTVESNKQKPRQYDYDDSEYTH